jgi:hypothetical protein
MALSDKVVDSLINISEAIIKQNLPHFYTFVIEKIYSNPHLLNVNLVLDKGNDHFRFINLSPLAIHVERIDLKINNSKVWTLDFLLHPSTTTDPSGKKAINRISFIPNPIFLYSRGLYFLPLVYVAKKIKIDPNQLKSNLENLSVDFVYLSQEGKKRTADNLKVSVVEVTETDN